MAVVGDPIRQGFRIICRSSGRATEGVYRWRPNPQYTRAIIGFGTLGLAAYSWEATTLAAALVLVYALMAVAEEAWLEVRYAARISTIGQRCRAFQLAPCAQPADGTQIIDRAGPARKSIGLVYNMPLTRRLLAPGNRPTAASRVARKGRRDAEGRRVFPLPQSDPLP